MDKTQFIKVFFKSPGTIGAILPSSNKLADLMIEQARLEDTSLILELGTGTGVFTEKIMQNKPQNARFIAFELHPEFVRIARKRCPDVDIRNEDAAKIREHLDRENLGECDCIISGLPWAAFSDELQERILSAILAALKPEGRFLTFAYIHGLLIPPGKKFYKKLQQNFSAVKKTKIVWKNVPPAFIYYAEK